MRLNRKDREGNFYSTKEALGRVGENILWNGPFDTTGLPKGKGSSSGKDGMIFNNDKPTYKAGPITTRAKARF
jgi:hypothetical protein